MNRWKLGSLFLVLTLLATLVVGCQPKPANDWERVQKAGKLVVGTSADYPPFEFMNDNDEFDGFDVKLMEEIGKQLELEIVWQDIGFDGLIGALQAGKIDAVIAAMSVTAERDEEVDFTQPYYIGNDAVLVAAGSGIAINQKEDLAGKIIGVQTGTVQDDWVTENLPDDEIHRYERAEQAILDLKSGRVEVVALDHFVALAFAGQGGVEMALETIFSSEEYSIAVPEGSQELQAQFDQVIKDLLDSGFIEELGEKYLTGE